MVKYKSNLGFFSPVTRAVTGSRDTDSVAIFMPYRCTGTHVDITGTLTMIKPVNKSAVFTKWGVIQAEIEQS